MPVQPPTIGQLQEIAGSFGLVLGDDDLDSFRAWPIWARLSERRPG